MLTVLSKAKYTLSGSYRAGFAHRFEGAAITKAEEQTHPKVEIVGEVWILTNSALSIDTRFRFTVVVFRGENLMENESDSENVV